MTSPISAAKAKAESGLKRPNAQAGDPVSLEQDAAAHTRQEKTVRLREARLAAEAETRRRKAVAT